ncbi:hypothetical protein B0T10DRAFT_595339 [Thelonectria olida]|uniref:Uncharacterized protein n=1 Tax=Thelonectria olida TaxID=1576542 RepID=A0A9P8W5X3_9HYPO|nr:hypothetical protein B0T10DRAFT_595339 [Thelonectria olida]
MLSINFSTPLAGAARSERIKQMTRNHVSSPFSVSSPCTSSVRPLESKQASTDADLSSQPAFEQARSSQEILVKIQTSLRRMPGVSAKESNEIISQLQEVGQIISQEVSQLVDALMNLQLDQEDTDRAIARMSIEANLAKAEVEDRTQNLSLLKVELSEEKDKRKSAEAEVSKVVENLQKITQEFKWHKEKENRDKEEKSPSRSEIIKSLEDTIEHLEGQVNNRRSLWVMKHSSPESVARAITTIAGSCPDKEAVHQSIMSLRPENCDNASEPKPREDKNLSNVFSDMALQPARPATSFQPNRAGGPGGFAAPPRFGPLTSGPPRAPSVMPSDRRPSSAWAPPPSRDPARDPPRWGPPQPGNANANSQAMGFGRAPSRRGFHNGSYRSNTPDFFNQNTTPSDKGSFRPESAYGHRQSYYPGTPSTTRSKYSRFRDPISPEYNGAHSAPMAARGALIHITEMTINAWNEQIMDLYGTIRNFVDRNACDPINSMPTDLSTTRLWPVLIATYFPLNESEAMSYLDHHLKEVSSKSCLVTRVIIDFIVNRVWVPRAWCGADNDTTLSLMDLVKEMNQTRGQPSSYRQPLLDRQATVIDGILRLDHYQDFSKERIVQITEMLLEMIRPLFNETASDASAYRDLEIVSRMAWALSSRILSSRLTFDFRFPEVGTRFSCQSMIPIWPNLEPTELQARHWRVALVTTPVITCRNDTGSNISAHSVALADVICMQ